MPFTDEQIRQAVINLFKKYDKDNTGYIDKGEVPQMLNDLGNQLASKKQMPPEQIKLILSEVDRNQDGKLTKD